MGSGWNGLVPCTPQSCESNKHVYTGRRRRGPKLRVRFGPRCRPRFQRRVGHQSLPRFDLRPRRRLSQITATSPTPVLAQAQEDLRRLPT